MTELEEQREYFFREMVDCYEKILNEKGDAEVERVLANEINNVRTRQRIVLHLRMRALTKLARN